MNRVFLALVGAWAFLSGCSSSDQIDGELNMNSSSASFGDVVKFNSLAVRGVATDLKWVEGNRIGINAGDYYTNVEYTVNNTTGSDITPATNTTIYYLDEAVRYTAYYPYNGLMTNGVYSISLIDQSDLDSIALLYAETTTPDSEVSLDFKHMLAKVKITFETDFEESVEAVDIKICDVGVTSTFDLDSGLFSDSPQMGDIEVTAPAATGSKSTSVDLLMLPDDDISDLVIMYYYDGRWWRSEFGNMLYGEKWESGNSYEYKVTTISNEIEEVKSISISGVTQMSIPQDDQTSQLKATVYPIGTMYEEVVWSSDNRDVATVDATTGLVTILKSGIATIKATSTAEGFTAISGSIEFVVTDRGVEVGDYLYKDMSFGVDPTGDILGVIYLLNEDGESGKILHIEEKGSVLWTTAESEYSSKVLITNNEAFEGYDFGYFSLAVAGYGMECLQEAYKVDDTLAQFPALAWVNGLNTTLHGGAVDYTAIDADATGYWYIPGEGCYKVELMSSVVANATINRRVEAAGGSILADNSSAVSYISSSEHPTDATKYRRVAFSSAGSYTTSGQIKTDSNVNYRARAIMDFDMNESN